MENKGRLLVQKRIIRTNYVPIVFENNFFWLRNDLHLRLSKSPLTSKGKIDKRFELAGIRYLENEIDRDYLRSLQSIHLPEFNLLKS